MRSYCGDGDLVRSDKLDAGSLGGIKYGYGPIYDGVRLLFHASVKDFRVAEIHFGSFGDVFDDHRRLIGGAKGIAGGTRDVFIGFRCLNYAYRPIQDSIRLLFVPLARSSVVVATFSEAREFLLMVLEALMMASVASSMAADSSLISTADAPLAPECIASLPQKKTRTTSGQQVYSGGPDSTTGTGRPDEERNGPKTRNESKHQSARWQKRRNGDYLVPYRFHRRGTTTTAVQTMKPRSIARSKRPDDMIAVLRV